MSDTTERLNQAITVGTLLQILLCRRHGCIDHPVVLYTCEAGGVGNIYELGEKAGKQSIQQQLRALLGR